ncbi:MAG: hypothetical protein OXL41_09250 [Nitrospinae bacterium]|nr:hypothetical protein [Nitrospinota bacterium]
MRNIFDQYSQPENRVTHALMSALNEDRKLLYSFLKNIVRQIPPTKSNLLDISEQCYPGAVGSEEIDENADKVRRIPDAWITAGEEWCLVIENKVQDDPKVCQLKGHLRTARDLGFTEPKGLLLTIKQPHEKPPNEFQVVEWSSVYQWLQGETPRSEWAGRVAAYLEVMEARMIEKEQLETGTLTTFSGFRFGETGAFNYLEGKRVLRLAMDELRKRCDLQNKIGVKPDFAGRKAIRGRKGGEVWDFLTLDHDDKNKTFTAYPHLTLGIGEDSVSAMATLPNNARAARRLLIKRGEQGFRDMVSKTLESMRPLLSKSPGMEPRLRVWQRRWPKITSPPLLDASIDINLRTYSHESNGPKFQPQWIDAAFSALKNKKSNLELQIGGIFPHRTCEAIQQPYALDLVAETWIACEPYLSALGINSSKNSSQGSFSPTGGC